MAPHRAWNNAPSCDLRFAVALTLSLSGCFSPGKPPAEDAGEGEDSSGESVADGHEETGSGEGADPSSETQGESPAESSDETTGRTSSTEGSPSSGGSISESSMGTSTGSTSSEAESEGEDTESGPPTEESGDDAQTTGTPSDECTRELLDGLLDDYFVALEAGDPSSLPLAETVKFTENAEEVEIGTTDFWMNAGATAYSQRVLDVEACSVGAQAVVPENGMDLPIVVRLKVESGEIVEVETIVVRPGDYTASFAVDSNPAAIIDIADDIGWHEELPLESRASREELISWIDKYFRAFPSGVCDVTSACRRLENGGGNFSCGAGASCTAGDPGPGGTFTPRVILADEERGVAIGFTIFDFMTTGHLDAHMIKMANGQVHAVQAMLRNTNGQSGWD